jgi:hypothetical protein
MAQWKFEHPWRILPAAPEFSTQHQALVRAIGEVRHGP